MSPLGAGGLTPLAGALPRGPAPTFALLGRADLSSEAADLERGLPERILVYSVGPIDRDVDPSLLCIRTLSGAEFERPASTRVLRALHGFEFLAEGDAVDERTLDGPAALWVFEPREWRGQHAPGFTLRLVAVRIWRPGAPLFLERRWTSEDRVYIDRVVPLVILEGMPDYRRLEDASRALERFTQNIRPEA
jgi:hypothetical protein